MENLLSIGTRIKVLRLMAGMTQDELAARSGYTSRSSINKIEKGLVDLPKSKIEAIAHALGTTPLYLLFGEEDEEKQNAPEELQLSEGEEKLLKLIRLMPEEMKKQYTELLESTLRALGLIQ